MKRKINLMAVLMALLLIFTLSACGNNSASNSGSSSAANKIKVTFDYNYSGASAAYVAEVNKGAAVTAPKSPERASYAFTGWYEDAQASTLFDFEYAIEKDVTVYAGWKQITATVKIEYNYGGSTAADISVEIGGKVSQPTTPTREGYLFTAWYTDANCSNAFDFNTEVNGDFTIYAGWEEDKGDTVKLTYMWNYESAPNSGVCDVKSIANNSKTQAFAAVREDYYLAGWFTDAACTNKFDFSKRITASVTLYAKWYNIFTFEAEYVDFSNMTGNGYSGSTAGVGLIDSEKIESQNASNGYYAGWMYKNGNALVFNITSDEAASDAVLVLRLSAEFYDMTFTDDTYHIEVNGENLTFSDFSITGVPGQGSGDWRPFTNFTITSTLSLKKGENVIKLIINNDNRLGESGTMYATAPLTDCIYIYTDVALSWEPITSNVN